tara:strand:+ start:2206 stop:2532 length:327 start_codon:yes stop_codon:yes gene_type:complete
MLYSAIIVSIIVNILLTWYIVGLLKKFVFISENLSDLYLITKAFQVFVKSLYSMDSYHGEPMIQELVFRTKEMNDEIENFRDIFEPTLDEEIEEELNAAEEEEALAQL